MADQWEYLEAVRRVGTTWNASHVIQVESINGDSVVSEQLSWYPYLAKLGNQGWELVAVAGTIYMFKRRKP